MRYSFP